MKQTADGRTIKERLRAALRAVARNSILVGLVSLAWLALRSLPKPSRLNYPCQKAALANAGVLVGLLPAGLALPSLLARLRCPRFRRRLARRGTVLAAAAAILGAALWFAELRDSRAQIAEAWTLEASARTHGPLGAAGGPWGTERAANAALLSVPLLAACDPEGGQTGEPGTSTGGGLPGAIDPLRVVSVRDPAATSWKGGGNPHTSMNQAAITAMVEGGVLALTGATNPAAAWRLLVPYAQGETIAIKLNFNNNYSNNYNGDPFMNPYAELVIAMIDGLVIAGVPEDAIRLADPSRIVNKTFYDRVVARRPGVRFYSHDVASKPTGMDRLFFTDYVPDGSTVSTSSGGYAISPALVFAEAAHIINVPQLKGHGGASVTLGIKNHFGSVGLTRTARGEHSAHGDFYGYAYDDEAGLTGNPANLLADIYDNPVFRQRTRLIVGDGLMGHPTINYVDPVTWRIFGDGPPAMLFFGTDPVAVDSVMFDYLQAEVRARSESARKDDLLHYAAAIGLGLHEHWDADATRRYRTIRYTELVR